MIVQSYTQINIIFDSLNESTEIGIRAIYKRVQHVLTYRFKSAFIVDNLQVRFLYIREHIIDIVLVRMKFCSFKLLTKKFDYY